jgi:hypothetical protein
VGQVIVFCRLPFIIRKLADDFRLFILILVFLFDRLVQVVVISHHPG